MREEPPFARIVATIRRRIETGELAPGDRVPSTRQITRQWGVAMATATKVLTALRQEGLVTAKVGVGTVVAGGAAAAGGGAGRAAQAGDAAVVGRAPSAGNRALAGDAGPGRAGPSGAGMGGSGTDGGAATGRAGPGGAGTGVAGTGSAGRGGAGAAGTGAAGDGKAGTGRGGIGRGGAGGAGPGGAGAGGAGVGKAGAGRGGIGRGGSGAAGVGEAGGGGGGTGRGGTGGGGTGGGGTGGAGTGGAGTGGAGVGKAGTGRGGIGGAVAGRARAGRAGTGGAGAGRAGAGGAGTGDASRASGAAAASQSTPEPPRVYPAEVTTAQVLRTAIAIADAEGAAAVSMRRVASELGVATMSLYRHVPSKDELFIQMVDVVMGDHRLVGLPPGDVRRGLELAGRTLWTVFRRHPWAAATLSLTRPRATPNALAYSEWVMRLLTEAGLHDHHVFQVHLTLFSYIRGMAVNLEWEAAAEAETGMTFEQYMDTQDDRFAAVVHSGGYPTVVELFTRTDFNLNLDELFEFGLRHLLDGFVGLLR